MPDEPIEKLGLQATTIRKLKEDNILTIDSLRKAIADNKDIAGIGTERRKEIDARLREFDNMGRDEASATRGIEPRFFGVGLMLLLAAIGLALWAFSKERLSEHHYWIMRWLLSLASGFAAGAFVGGLTVRSHGFIPGLVATAAGGYGVWLITFFVLRGPEQPLPPDRTVGIRLVTNGQVVPRRFTVRYHLDDPVIHTADGIEGQATATVPGTASVLKDVTVIMPCYVQQKQGAFEIVEGKPIDIEVRPTLTPPPPPLLPSAFPDVSNLVPDVTRLKATGREKAFTNKVNPGGVVFQYENRTDQFLYLLLYSFDPQREERPWRELQSDPCQGVQAFNNFTERTGLFAIIARTDAGDLTYLGHADLYAKSPTLLVIEKSNSQIAAIFR